MEGVGVGQDLYLGPGQRPQLLQCRCPPVRHVAAEQGGLVRGHPVEQAS
jgi:hypothetical protein